MPQRTILHADMDAFYAAIEQRDRPELRGKPVIVGGSGPRQVVCTASYEARRFGVHSAMPGKVAQRLCPSGVFVAPRMDVYARVSEQIQLIFQSVTDQVEPLSLDEAFLDVTGSRLLFGDGEAIARRIKEQVKLQTQLTLSVGVASNKYVAKVASDLRKPDGLVVVAPGGEREFLAPLPVRKLWGVGGKTEAVLHSVGLRTIAQVQQLAQEQLCQAFGAHLGEHLFVLANGLDRREVTPDRLAQSIGHELTFAEDLRDEQQIRDVLLHLCEQVGRRLRTAQLRATVVRLKLRAPDFVTLTRQQQVLATADDLALHAQVCALLRSNWHRGEGVRLLGVTAAGLVASQAPVQGELFGAAPDKRGKVLAAMDSIRERHGDAALRHGNARGD